MPVWRDYNPTNDLVFKFVFGRPERKNVTLAFINDVLGREGDAAFVDLEYRNVEFAPLRESEKLGRLDVFGILNDGTRVDIEMQVVNHLNMEKRTLFYWAHMYLHFDALKAGEGYGQLKPAISINILRYNFLPQENPHAKYVIMNPETRHQLTDDLELHFLEIPKYQSKEIKKMSRIERWLAYFANQLDKEGKEELAMSSPAIKEAMTASECYVMNDKSYQEYLARESAILDYNNDVLGNRRLGREEGRKEGREEGHREGRKEGRREGRREGLAEGQKKGMDTLAALNRALLAEKRYDDLARASSDASYRQQLLTELGIE